MAENNIEKNSNIEKINEDTVSESKVAGNSEKQEKPKTTKTTTHKSGAKKNTTTSKTKKSSKENSSTAKKTSSSRVGKNTKKEIAIEEPVKANTKKIYKKVFANIILGIVVTLYFIGIGIGFLNIDGPTFITDLKVFSLSILAIAIILFEFAYGKDDDKTALYGVEMLFVAIMSLVLLYTCILHKDKFIAVANIVACIGVLYYLVKSISIYIREKLKWKKTISDVKEIVAEE